MREYLKGWMEESRVQIPPIPDTGEEEVVIRSYVPPLKKEPEEATVPLEKASREPEGDDAPTVLLSREVNASLYLIRCSTGERIEITKDPFVLGKGSECDYIIKGNPSVSRMHAKIIKRDGSFYLEDLVSLNHTYAADQQVTEEIRLKNGMELMFADEKFQVEIEVRK